MACLSELDVLLVFLSIYFSLPELLIKSASLSMYATNGKSQRRCADSVLATSISYPPISNDFFPILLVYIYQQDNRKRKIIIVESHFCRFFSSLSLSMVLFLSNNFTVIRSGNVVSRLTTFDWRPKKKSWKENHNKRPEKMFKCDKNTNQLTTSSLCLSFRFFVF